MTLSPAIKISPTLDMEETCKQWNLLSDLDCPWYPCCAVFFFFIETGHWDLLLTKPVYFLFRHFLLERLIDWKFCFLFYVWKNLSFFTSLNSVNLISWFAPSLPVFVVVQLLSCVQLFETPWTAACQASLPFTISRNLLKLVSIVLVMPSNHLVLCHPLLLPSIFPNIRVFSNQSALHIRWPKCWSFSMGSSNEYPGLISFRMDWLDLLAVQRTLKSLLQHHSSKTSILGCSAFFMVQLSHLYVTAGKIIGVSIFSLSLEVFFLLFVFFLLSVFPASSLSFYWNCLTESQLLIFLPERYWRKSQRQ